MDVQSATQDRSLLDALAVVSHLRHARRDEVEGDIDLSFASQRWQVFVAKRRAKPGTLDRRALEVCVFVHLADALQTGDLFIVGAETFADYRAQLLPWAECEPRLAGYCAALGIPEQGEDFAAALKAELVALAAAVDAGFPANTEFSLDAEGTPHLKQLTLSEQPPGLAEFEGEVHVRLQERHLLDILRRTEHWSRYTRHFGPPSGADPKLAQAIQRYLFTVFGYGCNLGPGQTARHAPDGTTAQTMRRINAQHVTAAKLEAAMVDVVDQYARFTLPRHWGGGRAAIADGTHVNLRENNLLGSQHIRYGAYGGIAYHHIADSYIALFTSFIPCGVWEAVHILDGLLKNKSAIRAETTKVEAYNDFLDWVSFGGPVIKSGDPVEQEKQLKYASLVANAVMLSNVADLTRVLAEMAADGHTVTPALVACLSPYIRRHILRFGRYTLDMDTTPEPLNPQPLPFEQTL